MSYLELVFDQNLKQGEAYLAKGNWVRAQHHFRHAKKALRANKLLLEVIYGDIQPRTK